MRTITTVLLAATLVLVSPVRAADEQTAEPIGPALPDRVRGLLLQEMHAIKAASKAILEALVRGRDAVVADKAQAIHDSFILKQEMTKADRKALMAAVPEDFVERDRAFHRLTGRLANAARDGDEARQRALFSDMIEACTGCHSRYAPNRFPGLRE